MLDFFKPLRSQLAEMEGRGDLEIKERQYANLRDPVAIRELLTRLQRITQSDPPLAILARRLRCVERRDQVRNLRTCDRFAERSADLLDRGRAERLGRHRHNGLSSLTAVSSGVLE